LEARAMGATRVLKTVGWMLPLLALGCMVRIDSCGVGFSSALGGVSVENGTVTMDGVRLEHERWVDVTLDAAGADPLTVATVSGPIELKGDPSGGCALSVHVHSQVEGDGEVHIAAGTLAVRSQHGGKVFINGVRGSVPAGIGLTLDTASGNVSIEGAAKGRAIDVDTASGDVVVTGSEPASIRIDTASGNTRIEGSSSAALSADTASGDVSVVGGTWGTILLDGASSDLNLTGCEVEQVTLDAASGDLVISGGHCKKAVLDTASGDIELLDGAKVDELRED
jgi:DUF4097 and DUF4098 domain-containing protein YvlB